jgi:hypothetical protein
VATSTITLFFGAEISHRLRISLWDVTQRVVVTEVLNVLVKSENNVP